MTNALPASPASARSGPGDPPRSPGIDLLRAIAIAAVMAYHVTSHGIAMPSFAEHGWMGVDLFFALSGYLIGWQVLRQYAAGAPLDWRHFMLGRALRILPAYFTVLALYALLPGWREGGGLQPLWEFVTFTVNLHPDWTRGTAFSHAWSLCVEQHFYLLFPLVAWLLAKRSGGMGACATAIAIVLGGMALRTWLWHGQVAPSFQGSDPGAAMRQFVSTIYYPTWSRLDGLLMGVMLAALRAFRPAGWARLMRHAWLSMAVGAVLVAAATRIPLMSAAGAVVLFPMVALGCTCLLAGAASRHTWIGRRTLPGVKTLAVMAFSLYLTHKQVYAWLDDVLPAASPLAPVLAIAIYALASLAAAFLLHAAIERPALRLRERLHARWLGAGGLARPASTISPDAGSTRPSPVPRATASGELR